MSSADFRVMPHVVAVATDSAKPDLVRYVITYATSAQPQFVAEGPDGRLKLVLDEKQALRFLSIADAEQRLAAAVENDQLPSIDRNTA